MEIKDLTGNEFQGCVGHDSVDALTGPGRYVIRVISYDNDPDKDKITMTEPNDEGDFYVPTLVDVLAAKTYDTGTQEIIAKVLEGKFTDTGKTYALYYNGNHKCFKYEAEHIGSEHPEIKVDEMEM